MKNKYTGLAMREVRIVTEQGFLTSSIVEVDADVQVESYKDGFADLGENGFEVSFE
ncbi:MAG: hypothetical protein MJZ07_07535 [Bacteroidales bacterium]|nr:hypothetical protein [Bacteroidales bacterium]